MYNSTATRLAFALHYKTERHDVDAARAERGTDGRGWVRLTRWNLEFDFCYYFFSHIINLSF
jgi:hypothetical protein